MEKLEIFQWRAGRAITGQIKTSPVEAILAEADIQAVATGAAQLRTIAVEKSLQMPDAYPKSQVASSEVRQRSRKTG